MNKPKIEWLKVEEFLLKSDKIGSHWQWDKHFLPSFCIFLSKTIVVQKKSRKFARLKIEQHYSLQIRAKRRGDKNSQTIDYQEKRRIRAPHKRTH